MKRLILVRAGRSVWADENRVQGTVSLPLSAAGKEALKKVAAEIDQLQPDLIFSSGNETAGPTATCLAELCSVKLKKIPHLRELDFGLWQGLRIEEVQKRFAGIYRSWCMDPTTVCPPQGETIADARQRIDKGMKTLARKSRDKTVVLVAAPIVACLVECVLTGRCITELWQVSAESASICVFERLDHGEMAVSTEQPIRKLPWPRHSGRTMTHDHVGALTA